MLVLYLIGPSLSISKDKLFDWSINLFSSCGIILTLFSGAGSGVSSSSRDSTSEKCWEITFLISFISICPILLILISKLSEKGQNYPTFVVIS